MDIITIASYVILFITIATFVGAIFTYIKFRYEMIKGSRKKTEAPPPAPKVTVSDDKRSTARRETSHRITEHRKTFTDMRRVTADEERPVIVNKKVLQGNRFKDKDEQKKREDGLRPVISKIKPAKVVEKKTKLDSDGFDKVIEEAAKKKKKTWK